MINHFWFMKQWGGPYVLLCLADRESLFVLNYFSGRGSKFGSSLATKFIEDFMVLLFLEMMSIPNIYDTGINISQELFIDF